MQKRFISYLITDPKYYGSSLEIFRDKLLDIYSKSKVDFALFRDKITVDMDRESIAKEFVRLSIDFGIKSFISGDISLAVDSKADGVHLTSLQFDLIKDAKSKDLIVIISTHTIEEAILAKELGADFITYSPIFASPHKGEPKGVDNLQNIVENYNSNVIALGGILNQTQINAVSKTGAIGFASIRYFVD